MKTCVAHYFEVSASFLLKTSHCLLAYRCLFLLEDKCTLLSQAGSIPGPGVICGLSLLLVLFSAPRGFSPGAPVFHSPQKTNISKFQF